LFDTAEIVVKAGDGGSGAISFRREKFVPYGGPDGGDGGRGGDVVFIAETGITNLLTFRRKAFYKAGRGGNGGGRKKHGARGKDIVLMVPLGTVISETDISGDVIILGDLEGPGQRVIVAYGGKAGIGNTHFASSTNQAPRIAQKGEPGEEKNLHLELRLIADVGIIGYPNVGKSTLLGAASAARPGIASYPFTTKEPIVGVINVGLETFVLAEIPGLIEGAHAGRGLGHDFLRHATRTRMFIHLVDGSSETPVEDMVQVNTELGLFDAALARKPQLVVVNKIDLPEVQARLPEIKRTFSDTGIVPVPVSAETGEGVTGLMKRAMQILRDEGDRGKEVPGKVFHPQPKREAVTVSMEEDIFVVNAPGLERIVARGDITSPMVRAQLNRQLTRLGVNRVLKKAGAKPGDRVRCGELEWEW